ncbi:MarR family winged helix-turn-helix transcriptional regulator [Glaciibacter superstes]|uniref:MarR family winged helix-turn-helix transcriptional regulator n=1 Tax=Glaciibacter superstes TaxID=501023 RepID=UPI0003B414BF|nr:MarR family transcriptional regulator [Glaciibacter superstes]
MEEEANDLPRKQDQARALSVSLGQLVRSGETFRDAQAKELHLGRNDLAALGHLYESSPLTPRDLALKMEMTSGTITPLLDRVERAGFLARTKNPDDRRSLLIVLTPAGHHAVEWVYEQLSADIAGVTAEMDASEIARITETIDLLSDALGAWLHAPVRGNPVPAPERPMTGPHAV